MAQTRWSTRLDQQIDPVALAHWFQSQHDDVVWLDSSSGGGHLIGTGRRLMADSLAEAESAIADAVTPVVGWFGYEAGTDLLPLPKAKRGRFPTVALLMLDRWLTIDEPGALTLWARDETLTWSLPPNLPPVTARSGPTPQTILRDGDQHYASLIRACIEHIRAGDAQVLCLTTALSSGPIDAFASHLRLRELSPVPHGGLLRIGGVTLSSASMEQFLQVRGGQVSTSPIKGTRRRLADPEADAALADELRTSHKERTENQTVADLSRADLAPVCQPGTITASELLSVRSYATVHQLVSTVTGQLRPGLGPIDALRATFPGASMTGAPKVRAVEILRDLEQHPRGVYSGCFGVIDGADADLAMVIRSVVSDSEGAHLGVGGGITALSVVDEEVAEVHLKSEALRRCLVGVDAP